MLKNKLKNYMAKHEDGFTIIEVIIVLVIGAVIMLAVFLVVPQLQTQQRNSQRQNNARRILTAVEQLRANGSTTFGKSDIEGITGEIKDPSGGTLTYSTGTGTAKDTVYVNSTGAKCSTNRQASETGGNGATVVVVQEPFTGTTSSTTGIGFCVTTN